MGRLSFADFDGCRNPLAGGRQVPPAPMAKPEQRRIVLAQEIGTPAQARAMAAVIRENTLVGPAIVRQVAAEIEARNPNVSRPAVNPRRPIDEVSAKIIDMTKAILAARKTNQQPG